jgi:hypothetical protein
MQKISRCSGYLLLNGQYLAKTGHKRGIYFHQRGPQLGIFFHRGPQIAIQIQNRPTFLAGTNPIFIVQNGVNYSAKQHLDQNPDKPKQGQHLAVSHADLVGPNYNKHLYLLSGMMSISDQNNTN